MAYGYWCKLYYDILDDAKLGKVPASTRWTFVACMAAAGELGEDGFLPDLDTLSWRLRVSETELEGDLTVLARRGLVELRVHADGSERWYVSNFAKRQAPVPGSERMRQQRKRQRDASVTKRHTDKDTDKDTDADKMQKQKQKKDALPRVAAAAAPALAPESNDIEADPDDNPTALVLRTHGIALNQTTARLLDEPADFVEGHLLAAQRRGESAGLAIRRIIDGDAVPRKPGDATRQSIPAELADIIKR